MIGSGDPAEDAWDGDAPSENEGAEADDSAISVAHVVQLLADQAAAARCDSPISRTMPQLS